MAVIPADIQMKVAPLAAFAVYWENSMPMNIPTVRLLLLLLVMSTVPAFAVNRTLTVTAPPTVRPGAPLHITATATTDAKDGEQIAFFHAEYSIDGGKTWKTRYLENKGRSATLAVDFPAGPEGSTAMVRVRVAFRSGQAGDVDFAGGPINWAGSWGKWQSPPARTVSIRITDF